MDNKTVKIENFIGTFDNYISKEDCKKAIDFYENQNSFNNSYQRLQSENSTINEKQDTAVNLHPPNIKLWKDDLKTLFLNFDLALKRYFDNSGINDFYSHYKYMDMKIQKTLPGQGYHRWHIEHSPDKFANRILVYSIYLNDVNDGGETEFLHQSVRVKPKTGRIVIWPAGFPYVHRGNPPLKGEKYILTSWIEC
jgi:hypothetical protein|tara:strand:+ start:671 stop:1255 length:585 start_codon:yes stop_codon:yes gene_type:complete